MSLETKSFRARDKRPTNESGDYRAEISIENLTACFQSDECFSRNRSLFGFLIEKDYSAIFPQAGTEKDECLRRRKTTIL
jgi:hypothetical protein